MVAGGMKTKDDSCAGRFFDPQALIADGHTSIATDSERGADAPDKSPPGATGSWAQDRSVFFFGGVPGTLRGLAQFAMDFLGVAMVT